jgi:hypothetical protein
MAPERSAAPPRRAGPISTPWAPSASSCWPSRPVHGPDRGRDVRPAPARRRRSSGAGTISASKSARGHADGGDPLYTLVEAAKVSSTPSRISWPPHRGQVRAGRAPPRRRRRVGVVAGPAPAPPRPGKDALRRGDRMDVSSCAPGSTGWRTMGGGARPARWGRRRPGFSRGRARSSPCPPMPTLLRRPSAPRRGQPHGAGP